MIAPVPAAAGFDFELPAELVAQRPDRSRAGCRLLCVARHVAGELEELRFDGLRQLLRPGDVLVRNVSRVLPARLRGRRVTGGAAELLLVEPAAEGGWWALARPGRKLGPGARVTIAPGVELMIAAVDLDGRRRIVAGDDDLAALAERYGHMPLPPYIARAADAQDRSDYQTVYARVDGSVAAPTAGLHFTHALLAELQAAGVTMADIVLHVGLGTFAPLRDGDPSRHVMHSERFAVPGPDLAAIDAARAAGGRIVAVGTTVLRTLESVARWRCGTAAGAVTCAQTADGGLAGTTRLFLRPPDRIAAADALITNFHLPRTTLLLLVQAMAGLEATHAAYQYALRERLRFYSYGDAMWIA
jgi:S-adenosylmethionine:tRNA ribosyltransferase-isomerase